MPSWSNKPLFDLAELAAPRGQCHKEVSVKSRSAQCRKIAPQKISIVQ